MVHNAELIYDEKKWFPGDKLRQRQIIFYFHSWVRFPVQSKQLSFPGVIWKLCFFFLNSNDPKNFGSKFSRRIASVCNSGVILAGNLVFSRSAPDSLLPHTQ